MKKILGVCVAVAMFAACGRTKEANPPAPADQTAGAPSAGATNPGPSATDPAPAGSTWMELRLLGENGDGYDAALLAVTDVQVTTPEGQALPVSIDAGTIDLARPNQAWQVARFAVPPGVEKVRVRMGFDDFGGYQGKVGSGEIDAAGAPIQFDATVATMRSHDRAVVHLDLGHTLRPGDDDARLLLPQYTVHY